MVRNTSAHLCARAAAAAAALCLCSLIAVLLYSFTPAGALAGNADERVLCRWSDASVTRESYAEIYPAFTGISADGEYLEFMRGGVSGRAETSEAFRMAYRVLMSGSLAELLSLRFTDGTRMEKSALYRAFSDLVWYSSAYFCWTGERAERVDRPKADRLVLLDGELSSALRVTEATKLIVRADADIEASAFEESRVEEIVAEKPYFFENGALYRESAAGTVLVCALPSVKELVVRSDTAIAEEGALAACRNLQKLTIPFAGNTIYSAALNYCGDVGVLFGQTAEGEYDIPETLVFLKITGGKLESYAFSGCGAVRAIDVCGIPADRISRQAFAGCSSLEFLHTQCSDPGIDGAYSVQQAECGCFIYSFTNAV